jgi:Spy/CpxP family protein refolding chaperone
MKIIRLLALLATTATFAAAETPPAPTDPLAGAFFPPELIMMANAQIGLTPQQQEEVRTRVQKTQARSDDLRLRLEAETTALASLARQDRVDEAAVAAQLDRVLAVERDLKHLQIGLLAGIKNLLTPEQLGKLRQIARDGGSQLADAMRQRLSDKVERVKEGARAWEASGRDTSAIAQAMQEKVKPLLDSGQPVAAEAELDRILDQLNPGAK